MLRADQRGLAVATGLGTRDWAPRSTALDRILRVGRRARLSASVLALLAWLCGSGPGASRSWGEEMLIPAPVLPDDAVQVADHVKACDGATRFYEHTYKIPPLRSPKEYDLMVIGLVDPAGHLHHGPPLIWLYFGDRMEITRVVLRLPAGPVEALTRAELEGRWSHVCEMIADLQRRPHHAAGSER